jgi:hypothetical protein
MTPVDAKGNERKCEPGGGIRRNEIDRELRATGSTDDIIPRKGQAISSSGPGVPDPGAPYPCSTELWEIREQPEWPGRRC